MGYKSGELEWNLMFMGSFALAYILFKKTVPKQEPATLQSMDINLY